MFSKKVVDEVLEAIEKSPQGIATLDVLKSLDFCGEFSLKTTLSRLNKAGRIIRLKRGAYSTNPLKDAFACAQTTYNGYLGFSAALYLHKIIAEMPFTIEVVTVGKSGAKNFGAFEFKAVSLKEKAVGFVEKDGHVVSTRAKTLFDCLYLPKNAVEFGKLIQAYREAGLSKNEWREFSYYVKKFASGKTLTRMNNAKKSITEGVKHGS